MPTLNAIAWTAPRLKRSLKHVYALYLACSDRDTKQVLLRRAQGLIAERRPYTWRERQERKLRFDRHLELLQKVSDLCASVRFV